MAGRRLDLRRWAGAGGRTCSRPGQVRQTRRAEVGRAERRAGGAWLQVGSTGRLRLASGRPAAVTAGSRAMEERSLARYHVRESVNGSSALLQGAKGQIYNSS
jgi:hypothetical protein